MSDNINNNNNNFTSPPNHFLHECIDLAIDGFLFRGITPSDHYYHFSRSFPQAFSNSLNTISKPISNPQRIKPLSTYDISLPEEKLSLTRISSKLSNFRTTFSNQTLSKNTNGFIDPFKSPSSELSYLANEVRKIEERMKKHRLRYNRPENPSHMTIKEIYDEKINVQQELLRFETKYSKPTKGEQKKIVKPLYDYYRQLKRLVENQQEQQI
ncbi:unnamed protein product [Adineta steineri]|uniref:Uncharacterized protein n=1 Tax=Adineta steineri TaxID=433720 RepID=A0A814B5B1_9BILA|nr:unnamed protein product [Adineta steineri]CAF1452834.1 unnamed protein product [Adineta steineri]